jgi:N-acetylglucosaminyl-diphospho-decaprenol L-rhamnosyltransferase
VLADLQDSPIEAELAVLDNHSGDDLEPLRKEFPKVSFYSSSKNRGFGGGHNWLAAKTKAPWICLLNPDITLTQRSSLAGLLKSVEAAQAVVAGPLLVTAKGKPQWWDHGELLGWKAVIANNAGHAYWKLRRQPGRVAWVSGAALLVRRDWFERVGGFDERYFLYKEEEDLCLQIRRQGGVVWYDPSIQMRHIGSVVAHKSEFMAQSQAYYFVKNFSPTWVRRGFDWLYQRLLGG